MIFGLKMAAACFLAAAMAFCQQPAYKNLQGTPVEPLEKFQFTLRSSNITSGSIATAGAKTLTVRPCPLGVNGSDPSHYLRISGGTGTAENVLITGGTCTSGAASGTLQFTTANTHTGAWSIASATAGIREGVLYLQGRTGGGELRLPYGNVTIYKGVVMEGTPAVTISGCGVWCSTIILDSSNLTDDVFNCTSTTCIVYFHDFTIAGSSGNTNSVAIHIKNNTAGKPKIRNVRAVDTAGGFRIENSDYVSLLESYYDQETNYTNAVFAIKVEGGSSDVEIRGGRYVTPPVNTAGALLYGLWVRGADGVRVSELTLRADIGIYIEPVFGTGSLILGSLFVDGVVVDTCMTSAVKVLSTGTPTGNDYFGNIYIQNSHLSTADPMNIGDMVSINTTSMGTVYSGINLENNMLANSTRSGISATDVVGLKITNNDIFNGDNASVGGYGVYINGGSQIKFQGNTLSDTRASPKQDYGAILVGTISFLNMKGNVAIGNASAAYLNNATLEYSIIEGNTGSEDWIPQVTAASTLSLPATLPKTMRLVSGSATVNIINTPVGNNDTRSFICDSGITFTATASAWGIGATLAATTAGQVVTCTAFTGTSRWYCR